MTKTAAKEKYYNTSSISGSESSLKRSPSSSISASPSSASLLGTESRSTAGRSSLTLTLEGKQRDCRTHSPRTPPRSLKMIVPGSLVPFAIAANGTVNPLFFARVGLDSNSLISFFDVGAFWRHVKTTHGLIHIDDLRVVNVLGFSQRYHKFWK